MLSILITIVILTAFMFHLVPMLVRPSVFFAVTISPDFLRTGAAREIVRTYRLMIWLNCAPAAAIVWWGLSGTNPLLLIAGITWEVAWGFFAFQWARRKAEAFAVERTPAFFSVPVLQRTPPVRLWIGPLVILAAGVCYLSARWEEIPPVIPIHWNMSGIPDRWAERTPGTVFFPLATGAALVGTLALLAYAISRWSTARASTPADAESIAGRKYQTSIILVMLAYFSSVLFTWMAVRQLGGPMVSTIFMVLALAVPLLGCIAILLFARGLPHRPAAPAAPGDGTDDRCWRGGVFYINRSDPALFVPKRKGLGWTLNFGHPASWLILLLMMLLPLVPLLLI